MSRASARPEPGATSRALAARAVAAVLGAGVTLDAAFGSLELQDLVAADRSQVKALAFGALRWHHRHRRLLALLLDRPLSGKDRLLEALLSVGLFQLLDARQPEYAAVSSTVAATRLLGRPRFAGVVNASLRRLQREREPLLAEALADEEARYSHPAWLIGRLRQDWPGDWQRILEAAQEPPPLWLRVNQARLTPQECQARLQDAGITAVPGPAPGPVPGALRLEHALPVADIPGFAAGELSVQDAASQLAAALLGVSPGMRVLDACAAPGGKTGQLLEQAGGRLDLLALDIDAGRMERVRENLARLALTAASCVADAAATASWWDGQPFDRILIDAPCSGTGVIRRHPDIKLLRREADIGPMARRQRELLEALWPLLRPGGRLLYATCSILHEENQAVVAGFLAAHPEAEPAEPPAGALPGWLRRMDPAGWQALPGDAGTDGLYYALMTRRPG
jgi:16S rRNA (cytosine967-C5)-methyltransferase